MALPLARLPRYLVLEPVSTMRFEVALPKPPCEVTVEAEEPQPGRSFLLMLGPPGGPLFHRMRLNGRATVLFDARDERTQVLLLSNPQREPLVLRLRGRVVPRRRRVARGADRAVAVGSVRAAPTRAHRRSPADRSSRRVAGPPRGRHGRGPWAEVRAKE